MNKRFRVWSLLVALSVALGCVAVGLAQEQQQRPVLGGYKQMDKDSDEAQAAADFAVGEQGSKEETTIKLVTIHKAESQVVAGKNYRLCMSVEVEGKDGQDDATLDVQVVVYRSLQNKYSLTSWESAECDGD